ncbi:unnamed protein product [Peniophora sp. CBMAI 1063]|nr:unnamed protein product [Peniophora sp. CBMAI 1063]
MATLEDRPFSKDYSGLENQSVIAGGLVVFCLIASAIMKRKRRAGARYAQGLGSVESWEFGYLFQGRSWARLASPPLPLKYPFQWAKQAIMLNEPELLELRGLDATLYMRWMRGCTWFACLHTFTTFPILLPIHVHFAGPEVSIESMTRASISSLVETAKGRSLLWVHLVLLFWVTGTWIATLVWICKGMFRYRKTLIKRTAKRLAEESQVEREAQYHPHPHPQYVFSALPSLDRDDSTRGIRLRSIMVTNIPLSLRTEKELKDYFTYYLTKPVPKPLPLTTRGRPGMTNRIYRFIFNHASTRVQATLGQPTVPEHPDGHHSRDNSSAEGPVEGQELGPDAPAIERVVIVRKMTELASLLERREIVLRKLETAHLVLAQRVLCAVRDEILRREDRTTFALRVADRVADAMPENMKAEQCSDNDMDVLIRELRPFVEDFGLLENVSPSTPGERSQQKWGFLGNWRQWKQQKRPWTNLPEIKGPQRTIWDALLGLPRGTLDAYQPLTHLNNLFRDKAVPAIDYYTAKLGLLTELIAENRAKPAHEYDPVSTAFVTFKDPADALKACQVLAVHPTNLLNCVVTMAPCYEDLDWVRLMKSAYRGEFVKDWVVNIGVWAFTIFWLFPLSLFVGLVSIQNISAYLPALAKYLNGHPWEEDVIQSFVPTLIVALLTLLIPILLLLIAKKAHTILTLSSLHDRIMTRYYKFLIVNILVFFCVGTAALQSVLLSLSAPQDTTTDLLEIVATSFPSAGPFYVGWLIFTTGIHSGLETGLFGLPLITYLFTRKAVTPRKRAVGIRPRTLNYYYWLPNHLLVFHVLALFSILNPLVIPFAWIYYMVDSTVIKNQLLHVYAKVYEQNGKVILIRLVRYSLDGLILLDVVFVAYMAVLKIKVNVALAAVLIAVTVFVKLTFTRVLRAQFDRDDLLEAEVCCGMRTLEDLEDSHGHGAAEAAEDTQNSTESSPEPPTRSRLWRTWKNMTFNYGTSPKPAKRATRRARNPFITRPQGPLAQEADAGSEPASPVVPGPSSSRPFDGAVPEEKLAVGALPTERRASRTDEWRKTQAPVAKHPLVKRSARAPERRRSVKPELERRQSIAQRMESDAPLVTPHPPHPRWDDEPDPDKPYENPYYSAPIGSSLWLPRNPCGLLDLDDTVDVHRSLTTVEAAGGLGEWHAPERPPELILSVDSLHPFPLTSSPETEEPPSAALSTPRSDARTILTSGSARSGHLTLPSPLLLPQGRRLSGTETISLPPRMMARADNPAEFSDDLAPDMEPRRRPSMFEFGARRRRRSSVTSGSYFTTMSSGLRRPTTRDAEHGPTASNLSLALPRRGLSQDQRAQLEEAAARGVRPDAGAQAALAQQATLSLTSLGVARHRAESTFVSAQEAVQAEVVVEEQEAADARLRQEAADVLQATRRRAWWQRWAFAETPEQQEPEAGAGTG